MQEEINNQSLSTEQKNLIIEVAKKAGKIILENGGETYRAEETCSRICSNFGAITVDVLAITTGIVLSVDFGTSTRTIVARIANRDINLTKVSCVNTISRELESGDITLEEADNELGLILDPGNPKLSVRFLRALKKAICTALAASFFSVLFGGGLIEFIIAFLSGVIVSSVGSSFTHLKLFNFITSLLSGSIAALIAIGASFIFEGLKYNLVIIGSTMPLLPGIAMTNAFRDSINGDLISGVSRLLEAFIIAIAIAAGVGAIIGIFNYFGLIGGIVEL